LSVDLPPRIVEELADGLEETYRHRLAEGLAEDAAARAAVAEFGEPPVIVAAFTRGQTRAQGRPQAAIRRARGSGRACQHPQVTGPAGSRDLVARPA
jgi:hypothetical protein